MDSAVRRLSSTAGRVGGPLLVGAAATAGSFAAVGLSDRFVGGALAAAALDVLPDVAFQYGIQWLGSLAAPLLVATMTLVAVGAFAAAVSLVDRAAGPRPTAVRASAAFLALGLLAAASTGSLASAVGTSIAGTIAFVVAEAGPAVVGGVEEGSEVRRSLLRTAGVVAGTVGTGLVLAVRRDARPAAAPGEPVQAAGLDDGRVPELLALAAERSFDLPNIEPLVSEEFYRVDINVTGFPSIDPADWSLRVHGAVDRERRLSYDDLTSLPAEHRFVTLRCVSDHLNGDKLDTALWTGTPLAPILESVGAGERCCVRLEAADGYYQAFPRAALDTGFLAWGMNGEPLPEKHGAPVRVLIPGHWGEINVKWLVDVEVRDEPATGYWEERGWHGTGPVETVAKFRSRSRDGDRVTIGGHAYAGTRGIARVEVSTDGGETWAEARLSEPLPGATPVGGSIDPDSRAADAWRTWSHEYVNPDRHEVTVRAVELDGTVQSRAVSDPFPSGASGWVSHVMYGAEG